MNATTKQHNWSTFLKFFSEQNKNRATRLGVFDNQSGAPVDYWIEDGMPLEGIDVDTRDGNTPTVEIMLGDATRTDSQHLTHTITNVKTVKIILTADGAADGLEIDHDKRKVTVLRFEN